MNPEDVFDQLGNYDLETKELVQSTELKKVYKIFNTSFQKTQLAKIIYFSDSIQTERFQRERDNLKSLRHESIPQLYNVHISDDFGIFIMEYIEGDDIRTFLSKQDAPPPYLRSAEIIRNVASVLKFAYKKQGVIHRDITPENLLIQKYTHAIYITDFGLSKSMYQHKTATFNNTLVGSLMYASPEQIHGKHEKINHTSDIYSLGVVLYELLTNTTLLPKNIEATKAIHYINKRKYDPPRKINPALPKRLEKVCLKMLEVDQEKRYQNYDDLIADLANFKLIQSELPQKTNYHLQRYIIPVITSTLALSSFVLYNQYKQFSDSISHQASLTTQHNQLKQTNIDLEQGRQLFMSTSELSVPVIEYCQHLYSTKKDWRLISLPVLNNYKELELVYKALTTVAQPHEVMIHLSSFPFAHSNNYSKTLSIVFDTFGNKKFTSPYLLQKTLENTPLALEMNMFMYIMNHEKYDTTTLYAHYYSFTTTLNKHKRSLLGTYLATLIEYQLSLHAPHSTQYAHNGLLNSQELLSYQHLYSKVPEIYLFFRSQLPLQSKESSPSLDYIIENSHYHSDSFDKLIFDITHGTTYYAASKQNHKQFDTLNPFLTLPTKSDEQIKYLKHILQSYNDIPDQLKEFKR